MKGSCICGAVTVTLPGTVTEVGTCHCEMCRRWCSGPWMSLQAPPDTHLEGTALRVYRSSGFAERGFCGECGSNVFHRPVDGPELAVSAGLFDPKNFTLRREIFVDRRPAFYGFTDSTEKMTSVDMAWAWAPKLIARRLSRWWHSLRRLKNEAA
ncbi:GFA family protein [Brevundimonas sp.]|uniref:GFA family protein n=1 Tax=Brevundimonas sp. TaxID=1871086 RepID=UPI00344B9872